ncbi:hypothetical protein DRW03_27460 [Corallococcus sp. H22C18031201]|uniref:DUF1036 domain-containing protein n=1 Tax=Citreicoccus inhibens TaxID=2849499 RepID=UPI000E731E85|nr:DUF1036 domain-containing protein [Citreicoccus inhibens]MBU8900329.1 DUF1036 domain-containing protein [Citreicoccus inhibens]RJS17724.1 hypothetical protein DRW03_27460 [Corallococcus sp. H22C18031201]
MTNRKLMVVGAVLLGVVSAPEARAWVQFCNGTNVTLWTAYSWYAPGCLVEDGSTWEKQGWWSLTPGQCKVVSGAPIVNRYSYYYAEGGGMAWAGPYFTCTPYTAFDWCDNTCSTDSRNLGYRQLDTDSYSNYTLTLTP